MRVEVDPSFSELRAQVRKARREFARSPDSTFVAAMEDAMGDYLNARSAGVSCEDGIRGIELVLRDAWPHRPSKFDAKCALCEDTGWRELFCDERMRCGRERCAKNPSVQHLYVEPCSCEEGGKKRKRQRSTEDEIAAVGRTARKRRGFSRMGQ